MKFTFLLLGILVSGLSQAGIYKCTDGNGKTAYQKAPCKNISNANEFNVATGGTVPVEDKRKQQVILEQKKAQEEARLAEAEKQKEEEKRQWMQAVLQENKKNLETIADNPKKFTAFAIPPYTLEKHPELVGDFIERLPEIQRYRRLAALKAIGSGECDRVEAAELNLRSSKKTLVFLVECSNTTRMYFNEPELSTSGSS